MPKRKFKVGIMHGHSAVKDTVEAWINECGYKPWMLIKEVKAGVILERFRNSIWDDIHCVVIIMSGDDRGLIKTKKDTVGKQVARARQNVVFELGYCFGAFDSLDENGVYTAEDAIILLKEEGVETFEDIHGLTYIEYTNRTIRFKRDIFKKALDASFEKAKDKYSELR